MARSLNGTTQYFTGYPNAAAMTGQTATIAARVNLSALPGSGLQGWIAFMGDDSGRSCNRIHINDAGNAVARAEDSGGTGQSATHGTALSTGVTYGIVGVFPASTSRIIYVDETTPVTESTDSPIGSSQTLTTVGVRHRIFVDTAQFLAANLIQDVAFWNVALTADEVKAFMRGVSPLYIRPASLKEYWPFRETSGNATSMVGTRLVLTAGATPSSVNPAPTLPILRPRFGLASLIGAGSSDVTVTLDPSAEIYIGGEFTVEGGTTDLTVTLDPSEDIYIGGDFTVTGGENITVTADPAADLYIGGEFSVSGGGADVAGHRALVRPVTRAVTRSVTRGVTGGSVAANPSPPAGDAIQQLLDAMESGEVVRLNDRTYNLRTGPDMNQGFSGVGSDTIYSRQFYDRNFQIDPAHPSWATEENLQNQVMGYQGGGLIDRDNGRLIYGGMAVSQTRKKIFLMGGGHSSGAMNHAVVFDFDAACRTIVDSATVTGTWDQFSDPAPYGKRQDTSAGEGGAYPPYGRDADWPALSAAFDDHRYPQTIVTGRLGPGNNNPPYALHSVHAIFYDDLNDRLWVSGYSVGLPTEDTNFLSAGGTCWLDCDPLSADYLRWTRISGAMPGGSGFYFAVQAPDGGNYAYYSASYVVQRMELGTEVVQTTSNGLGEADIPATGGITWVKDLTEAGYWDLVFWREGGNTTNSPFGVHRKQYPYVAGQNEAYYPASNFSGATPKFGARSGLRWVSVDRKLYAAGFLVGAPYTFFVQTIDPFVGDPTAKATWVVADITLSGDTVTPSSATGESEIYNRFEYLPDYDAFILVNGYQYGDVYLIKR